ncbi:MAG: carboxypeptidase-like regulatory domain-containing protein, partial [Bacteroidetes bacterium]|nr:carboxypeptidase-like regulatory domain-containing protein [Bacteroidota bacterium]
MMRLMLVAFSLLYSVCLHAQVYEVSGRVIDSESRVTLPFVNIVINDGFKGGTTDIDGKFSLKSNTQIKVLSLSYVGYEPLIYEVADKYHNLILKMTKKQYELPEYVVFPTENPAHRIIKNTIAYRDYNDPEKLPAFSYTSYDKMIFTPELDSIPEFDSLVADTSDTEVRDFLEKHHLFIMETVSERKFRYPDKNHEEVIATKVAGFKDPIFVFLLSQMQSTTFYSDRIRIAEKEYINPISKGSTEKYFFLLQDTLYYGEKDTTFVISFRPHINTNFDGLEGVISISTNNWAVQNVIAEPAGRRGLFSFRIEQMYEYIQGKQWFPVQLNTIAILNHVRVGDSAKSLQIGTASDTSGKGVYRLPFGFGKSYIKEIDLSPEIRRSEFGSVVVDVNPEASHRDEDYWTQYRIDSLSQKEINTYDFVDSISREENFDKAAKTFESLMTGRIPWGKIDLDIRRFLNFNEFEGLALGAGIHTGDRISEVFRVGGYARFGLGDNNFKYGGDLRVVLYHPAELEVNVSYMKDLAETSGVRFFDDTPGFFKPDYFRDLLIRRMDRIEKYEGAIGLRAF